jgi:hypothetical protein
MDEEDLGKVARDNAISFEAVKTSMTQNKQGTILRLALHPNDCPPSLHTDWVGQRYQVAMVPIDDDDTPKVDVRAQYLKKLVQSAGLLCRNPEFQTWIGASDEDSCIKILRARIGVKSRAELKTNPTAEKLFEQVRDAYINHKRGR